MIMDAHNIAEVLCKLQNQRALIVGDVMLDRFIDGEVTRISPEAPVPILGKANTHQMPGGAANVACNLAHFGLDVMLIGVIGDDDTGASLTAEIAASDSIDFTPVIVPGRITSLKTRFRSAGQQILRVDDETTDAISDNDIIHIMGAVTERLADTDVLILSDYAKGCLPPSLLLQLIDVARKMSVKVIVDPKLADLSAYAGANLITPNLAELRLASNSNLTSVDDISATAANLAAKHNIGAMMVTMSAKGMLHVTSDGEATHAPATARDVFDVSGAGDTVIAVLAATLSIGLDPAKSITLANLAAGVAVGKSGTAIVSPGEIISQTPLDSIKTDTVHWAEQCRKWRTDTTSIGFTNGCFDLLHPGHLYLLHAASQRCDRLIVGVNSDASVKRLKGPTRPIQKAETRAAVIASLPFVDGVVIFDEDTPLALVTTLQPDVILKGGDYTADDVVGGDVVKAHGGNVVIIPTHGSHSSSAIINA